MSTEDWCLESSCIVLYCRIVIIMSIYAMEVDQYAGGYRSRNPKTRIFDLISTTGGKPLMQSFKSTKPSRTGWTAGEGSYSHVQDTRSRKPAEKNTAVPRVILLSPLDDNVDAELPVGVDTAGLVVALAVWLAV